MVKKQEPKKNLTKQTGKKRPVNDSKHWRRLRSFVRQWRQWGLLKRIVVAIALSIVTALGLFLTGFLLSIAAFVVDYPDSVVKPINPSSPNTVKARTRTEHDLEKAERLITEGSLLKLYSKESGNLCYKGNNGIKSSDGYSSQCAVTTSYYYGLNTDYKSAMKLVDQNLQENGWELPPNEKSDRGFGSAPWYENGFDTYPTGRIDTLSADPYTKKSYKLAIEIQPKEQDIKHLESSIWYAGDISEQLFKDIVKDNDYVVTITIRAIYASKPSLRDGLF